MSIVPLPVPVSFISLVIPFSALRTMETVAPALSIPVKFTVAVGPFTVCAFAPPAMAHIAIIQSVLLMLNWVLVASIIRGDARCW